MQMSNFNDYLDNMSNVDDGFNDFDMDLAQYLTSDDTNNKIFADLDLITAPVEVSLDPTMFYDLNDSGYISSLSSPFSETMSSATADSFDNNVELDNPIASCPPAKKSRGRPRKLSINSDSLKVRTFREHKKALDQLVIDYGYPGIYHGIANKLEVSQDYEIALSRIAKSQSWKQGFINKMTFTSSKKPSRGRRRCGTIRDKTKQKSREYNRKYNAQQKPGICFQFLKDVLTKLKEKNSISYDMAIEQILKASPKLFTELSGKKTQNKKRNKKL